MNGLYKKLEKIQKNLHIIFFLYNKQAIQYAGVAQW